MSEFSSFYMQVHIEKDQANAFFSQPCKNLSDYSDWQQWFLEEQRIYGDPIQFLETYGYRFSGPAGAQMKKMAAHTSYDEENKLLIMDNINIGQSFEVIMQYLIVFRGIAAYALPDTQENFLVVYPYWWGDRDKVNHYADAYIEFKEGHSILESTLDSRNMEIATAYYDKNGEAFAEEFYNKYGSF